jgi:hypothetical protein
MSAKDAGRGSDRISVFKTQFFHKNLRQRYQTKYCKDPINYSKEPVIISKKNNFSFVKKNSRNLCLFTFFSLSFFLVLDGMARILLAKKLKLFVAVAVARMRPFARCNSCRPEWLSSCWARSVWSAIS